MNTTRSIDDLGRQIEAVVKQYIEAGHREAQAAMSRAFGPAGGSEAKPKGSAGRRRRTPGDRRSAEEVAELRERLYEAMCKKPGEKMAVLATDVGATVRELNRPMTVLKREGRIRSVGQRQHTRYYPAAS